MISRLRAFMSTAGTETFNQAKRLVRIVIGFTVLIIGITFLVLPGPAIVVIPIGLLILAGEFVWARRLLKKFKDGVNNLKKRF